MRRSGPKESPAVGTQGRAETTQELFTLKCIRGAQCFPIPSKVFRNNYVVVRKNSVRLQNQQDTVRLRNTVTWFGCRSIENIIQPLLGTVVRALDRRELNAVCETATCDPVVWRRSLSRVRIVRAKTHPTVRRRRCRESGRR